jgi:uncharacterized protein involved in response to NO
MIRPYQIFFPLGIFYGILGISLWHLYAFQQIPYPGALHTTWMSTGFLFSFCVGFLLTAIPRFTGSPAISPPELAIGLLVCSLPLFPSAPQSITSFLILLFLGAIYFSRNRTRTFDPPPAFVFIPTGILLGLLGCLTERQFTQQYTVLFFIVGVGSRVVPAILGFYEPHKGLVLSPQTAPSLLKKILTEKNEFRGLALLLFAACITSSYWRLQLTALLIPAVCTIIFLRHWKLYTIPRNPGPLSFLLFGAAWILLIGLWLKAIFINYQIHAAHLTMIGGYSLITLLIGTRVSLAHGGHPNTLEVQSKFLYAVAGFIILAGLTRASAFLTHSYATHLTYAATLWGLGLLFWTYTMLPKILISNPNPT